jgi:hypothetical protein
MGGLHPALAKRLFNLAVYFLKRGGLAGQMTFAKFKVWMQRRRIGLKYKVSIKKDRV